MQDKHLKYSRVEMTRDLQVHNYHQTERHTAALRADNSPLELHAARERRADDTTTSGNSQQTQKVMSLDSCEMKRRRAARTISLNENKLVPNRNRRLRGAGLKLVIVSPESKRITPESQPGCRDFNVQTCLTGSETPLCTCDSKTCTCSCLARVTGDAKSTASASPKWLNPAKLTGLLLRFVADHFSLSYGNGKSTQQDTTQKGDQASHAECR